MLIGSNVKFHLRAGGQVSTAAHPTSTQGEVQDDPVLDSGPVNRKNALEMNDMTWVFSMLH
jgi:hypothetical protein